MSEMVEVAREYGISPSSMLDSLRMMRRELNENPNPPAGFTGSNELMGATDVESMENPAGPSNPEGPSE